MMRSSSSYWPSVNAMVFGLGLCLAVTAVTPTTSHAIPSNGQYQFDLGQALSGTFTVLGSSLSDWHITDPGGFVWTPAITPGLNNQADFSAFVVPHNVIQIVWAGGPQTAHYFGRWGLNVGGNDLVNFSPIQAAVPEPSGLALMGLGLGVLALYGWRQRRQAGLQIG